MIDVLTAYLYAKDHQRRDRALRVKHLSQASRRGWRARKRMGTAYGPRRFR